MTPIDIQVSRSKVSVEDQAYSLYVGEGALVFYKQLYLKVSSTSNIKPLWVYMSSVSRAFMVGAAGQAGDTDSSQTPGPTSGFQGCMMYYGTLLLVPRFFVSPAKHSGT